MTLTKDIQFPACRLLRSIVNLLLRKAMHLGQATGQMGAKSFDFVWNSPQNRRF